MSWFAAVQMASTKLLAAFQQTIQQFLIEVPDFYFLFFFCVYLFNTNDESDVPMYSIFDEILNKCSRVGESVFCFFFLFFFYWIKWYGDEECNKKTYNIMILPSKIGTHYCYEYEYNFFFLYLVVFCDLFHFQRI